MQYVVCFILFRSAAPFCFGCVVGRRSIEILKLSIVCPEFFLLIMRKKVPNSHIIGSFNFPNIAHTTRTGSTSNRFFIWKAYYEKELFYTIHFACCAPKLNRISSSFTKNDQLKGSKCCRFECGFRI